MTLASIYERHVTEIRREQPDARRIDASRLDAEVAVRMAVTGHSREQIAKAILDGARASRPHEDRDWQAYARRAVQRAFSLPASKPGYALSFSETSSCGSKVARMNAIFSDALVVHRGDCDPARILAPDHIAISTDLIRSLPQ